MEINIDDYDNSFFCLNQHIYNNKEKITFISKPPIILTENKEEETKFVSGVMEKWSVNENYFKETEIYFLPNKLKFINLDNGLDWTVNVNYFPYGMTYYHAFTEVIPNLLYILDKINDKNINLYIPKSNFIGSLLEWFEIKNPYFFKDDNYIILKNQIIQPNTNCGNISPESVKYIRNIVEKKSNLEKKIGIFIYRREVTRNIINSNETFECIKKIFYNIEWKLFDVETIKDTAELFSKAKIIIAPHGGGLTNMLFAPKNIIIIEIMPYIESNMCYSDLSKLLNNTHYIYPNDYFNENKQMQIDLNKFEKILSKINI